jgi:putative peptide zinc metalloprotease protein
VLTVTSDTLHLIDPPRLAAGVELLGQVKNSGFAEPPSLVRRADGQVIQLSKMMYLVASLLNGTSEVSDIAVLASAELGRTLTAEQVTYLLTAKLAPLGIVGHRDEQPAGLPTASPLLALRARFTLLPSAAASAAGTLLRPLFHWPVMAAVLGSVGLLDYWILSVNGLSAALRQLLGNPADLLIVAGLSVVSALFHECGHAAACRYGGAKPGRIGAGIYLVWPSFFTNVTDSYRLSRAGRLRTDLGGLYFNLIFILVLAGIYATTPARILLLVIAVTHLEMLEQLLPFVRFDGYFILSDLVGVPDLFARVRPVLRSTLGRGRGDDARAAGLRRNARIVITAWVLTVVPLLACALGFMVLNLPAANRALWRSAAQAAQLARADLAGHQYAAAVVAAIGGLLAVVSMAGTLYVMAGLLRRAAGLGRRWSAGRPWRRVIAVAAAVVFAGSLTLLWLAMGQFRDW